MRFFLAAVIALTAFAATAPAASAWQIVSEANGANTDETSAVRGTDGVLHIVYTNDEGETEGIRYRTMSTAGRLSAPQAVISGWAGVTNPDIELIDGVPTVFWGGLQDTVTANPRSSGKAWTATLSGGTWVEAATPFTTSSQPYASSQVSSVADGATPWLSWSGTSLLGIRAGADPATAELNLSTACCDYAANLGRDAATGAVHVVYYSNATGTEGYWTRQVGPTLGTATRLPSQAGSAQGFQKRMSAASRTVGGGVFTAYCSVYPTCSRLAVSNGTKTLTRTLTAAQQPTLADAVWTSAAPNGRMWLAWTNRSGAYATRSNKAFTAWGPIQRIAMPRGADTPWSASGDGARGWFDLFSNITVVSGETSDTRIQHQRFLPALSITPPILIARNNVARVVRLRLRDAGDPIVGKIRFRGELRTTNAAGYATFVVPAGTRPGVVVATGTATGYVPAKSSVRITR